MSTASTQSTGLSSLADVHSLLTSSSSTGLSNNVSKLVFDLYFLNVIGVLQKKVIIVIVKPRKSTEAFSIQNNYPDSLDHFVAGSKVNKAVSSDFALFFGVYIVLSRSCSTLLSFSCEVGETMIGDSSKAFSGNDILSSVRSLTLILIQGNELKYFDCCC